MRVDSLCRWPLLSGKIESELVCWLQWWWFGWWFKELGYPVFVEKVGLRQSRDVLQWVGDTLGLVQDLEQDIGD